MNKNSVIAYIRISTDSQDIDKQKHLILDYAQKHKIIIDEFIEIEISSQKSTKLRRVDFVIERLSEGDVLVVAELSRLGRNMLETLNIINEINTKGVEIIFIRQPELSTNGPQCKLLFAIYSYFAEAERDYISIRTKQGLAAARAKGIQLGRPKGSKNKKSRRLDPFISQIEHYLKLKLSLQAILKIINNQIEEKVGYSTLRFFVRNNDTLADLVHRQSKTSKKMLSV